MVNAHQVDSDQMMPPTINSLRISQATALKLDGT
jgi:hypothetical protein